jgi:DNA repair protein RadD
VKLRDYQRRALAKAEGKKRVLFVAPTGAGKGTMAAALLAQTARTGGRALFIVHLRDIAEDMAERVRAFGVRAGLVLPPWPRDDSAPVQVASVQSLARDLPRTRFDLAVVDEAHHYRAEQWEEVLATIRAARLVGFTATPERSDGRGLGDTFETLVNVASYSELLSRGLIVDCRVKAPPYRLEGGTAMEPAAAYLKYAPGTSALIFVRSLKTATHVCAALRAKGMAAEAVSDETPYDRRSSAVADLRSGRLRAIVNYGTMTEGVDVPRVETIVLEQTCKHAGGFLQRVGRALRPFPGKERALLIDLSAATYRHGMPVADRVYSLKSKDPIALPDGLTALKRGWCTPPPDRDGPVELVDVDADWLARNGGPRFVNWSALDWSLGNEALARQVGCGETTIARKRAELGIPPTVAMADSSSVDWSSVDWSLSDHKLSKLTGCSAQTVWRRRRALGIAGSRELSSSVDWSSVDWSLSDEKLAKLTGCGQYTVWRRRREFGIPGSRTLRRVRGGT